MITRSSPERPVRTSSKSKRSASVPLHTLRPGRASWPGKWVLPDVALGSHATYFAHRNYFSYDGHVLDEALTYYVNPQKSDLDIANPSKRIDVVVNKAATPEAYTLSPLTNSMLRWEGHWGCPNGSIWPAGKYDNGPKSPGWRTSGTVLLYNDARDWHNKFVKSTQNGDGGEPDIRIQ